MNLVVSAITMVDLTHREAKKVHFQSGKNLLTSGSNHLGKSVIMKSIFYTLGAEVFYPEPIKRINLLTFIDFMLDNHSYRVARLKNTFALYCDNVFDGYYASTGEFEEKLSELFNLEINLVGKDEDGSIVKCPPAYYYMPYYIDQENGWAANSHSFDRLGQFDLTQRKNSYFFHLGALDSNYVKISKLHKANKKQITQLEKENDKYRTVLEALQAGINGAQMSFDSQSLERAIISRQVEIKRILAEIAKARTALLEAEDQKVQLEYEKDILSRYIKKKIPATNISDSGSVECPRCGMIFDQELTQRLEKTYLLESLHDDFTNISEKLILLERRVSKYRRLFESKQKELTDFENSLQSDREEYNAYLKSKATNQLIVDYSEQIATNIIEIERLRADNAGYNQMLATYNDERTTVNSSYLGKLEPLFSGLDIPSDQIAENSEPGSALVASGAYGPRCKIAQILAFVETKKSQAPDLISFPIVIDSPNALEQDDEHFDSVMRTLFTWNKTDNQVIVASIQGKEVAEEQGNVNIILLSNPKNHLFSAEEYTQYEYEIAEIFTRF